MMKISIMPAETFLKMAGKIITKNHEKYYPQPHKSEIRLSGIPETTLQYGYMWPIPTDCLETFF